MREKRPDQLGRRIFLFDAEPGRGILQQGNMISTVRINSNLFTQSGQTYSS